MTPEEVRVLLCELGRHLRDAVLDGRGSGGDLTAVVGRSAADTMYGIDRFGDAALLSWFSSRWPADEPVLLVTEALDVPLVVPGVGAPAWTVIVDPLDGTRGLMYDKRPAWVLAAAAPVAPGARLTDVVAASMTEVPTTKQDLADQLSARRGGGVVAERFDVRADRSQALGAPLVVRPSSATDVLHGWSSFARFLPAGKSLLAAFEERLWVELLGTVPADLAVFDDQYLATGGQFHELLAGHDRVLGDLRPLAHAELGLPPGLACHPYDCCTALLLEEAGCVVTDPWGGPLDVPLDTTTPVAWVGYANPSLAASVGPAVRRAVEATFSVTPPA